MNDVGSDCTPSLAERLEELSDRVADGREVPSDDAGDVAAAAVAVRERDALRAGLDAIDRTWDGYTMEPQDVYGRVERTRLLAREASAVPVPERPERCPTCVSDSPAKTDWKWCPDPFHTPPSTPEEPTDD